MKNQRPQRTWGDDPLLYLECHVRGEGTASSGAGNSESAHVAFPQQIPQLQPGLWRIPAVLIPEVHLVQAVASTSKSYVSYS